MFDIVRYDKNNKKHFMDIAHLTINLRDKEVKEIGGNLDSLKLSADLSIECYIAKKDGLPVGIFGVGKVRNQYRAWLLGTNELNKYKKDFLRTSKCFLYNNLLKRYDSLCNYVPVWYEETNRWLKWLGFKPSKEIMGYRKWEVRKWEHY